MRSPKSLVHYIMDCHEVHKSGSWTLSLAPFVILKKKAAEYHVQNSKINQLSIKPQQGKITTV